MSYIDAEKINIQIIVEKTGYTNLSFFMIFKKLGKYFKKYRNLKKVGSFVSGEKRENAFSDRNSIIIGRKRCA